MRGASEKEAVCVCVCVGRSGAATCATSDLSSLGGGILEDSGEMGYGTGVFIGVSEDWRDRRDIPSNPEHRTKEL